MIRVIVMSVCSLSFPAIAMGLDDPCEDATSEVAKFVASLPDLTSNDLRQGRFDARSMAGRVTISYRIGPREILHRSISHDPRDGILEVTPIKAGGNSALFFKFAYGAAGRTQCSYVVFQSFAVNRFQFIQVSGDIARIEDLDTDGESEIVALESQRASWADDCPLSMAQTPYWHRIYHLNAQTGRLVDVSAQFPRHYTELATELKALNREAESTNRLSVKCRRGFVQTIERAEKLAQGSLTLDKNANQLVEPLPSSLYKGAQGFKGTQYRSDLFHLGKDYCVEAACESDGSLRGTSFYSISSGTVLHTRFSVPAHREDGVGNYITIDHGNGIIAVYMHLAKIFVKDGQQVSVDTILGEAGDVVLHSWPNCGHLHLEIRKGNASSLNVYPNLRYSYVSRDGKSRLSKPLGGEAEVLAWIDQSFLNPEVILNARKDTQPRTSGNPQRPIAGPPLPFEDSGACPFECCTYRTWTANKETIIHHDRSDSSAIVFRVRRGEKVTGVTGVVVTTRAGRANLLKSLMIGGLRANAGETVYLLTNLGEGFRKVWYKGKVEELEVYTNSAFKIIEEPADIWWVKIKNRNGQTGWSRQPNNFDNKDSCG